MDLQITTEIFNNCTRFAKLSVGSSQDKYARRNQFSVSKIIKDIRNGKIGEELVWQEFVKKIPQLQKPDYNIYDKINKSWDPDLKDLNSDIKIAVKSQDIESAIHFGQSWVFQYGHGGKYDCDTGIFKSNNDDKHYVSFVALNVPLRKAEIKAVVSVQWLKDHNMFKEMKKASLRGNKVAVYYEDLEKYKTELWQL